MVRFSSSGSQGGRDDKETVTVQRRRRPTSSGARQRADAPSRDRDDEVTPAAPPPRPPQGPGGPSGGGGSFPPSGGLPSSSGMGLPVGGCGGRLLLVVLLVLAVGAFLLFNSFGGGGGDTANIPQAPSGNLLEQAQQAQQSQQTEAQRPTAAPRPNSATATGDRAGQEAEWLVMLYQDADDQILEHDIDVDFNEAERAGSGDAVHVVSQLDRYQAGYTGDGNWTGTKRFYVTYDEDLGRSGSIEVQDLGEANMADGETLVDFVTWAVDRYPAKKHVLILSDHGMGWPGGWTDPTAPRSRGGGSPMEQRLGDQIFLNELDDALTEIRQQTGVDKFELIGLDACLMSHLEVYSVLAQHARYAVASQETEPAVGWAYASFLNSLAQNPDIDGAELGKLIVDSYIEEDQRILDDEARAAMTGGRGMFGAPSAQQLANQLQQNTTLAAVDLSAIPGLMQSLNDLSYALQEIAPKLVAQAGTYAESYTSVFGRQIPPSYIDLGNFTQILQGSVSGDAAQAVGRVQEALSAAVIAERHGSGKKGSNGISVYFPNSNLYSNPVAGYQSYGAIAQRFAQESLWDDFLNFIYTGKRFEAGAATVSVPANQAEIRTPAAGEISVSPIRASATSVAPGETVSLSVDISGDNIGYVKLLAGYYDQASNSIYVADEDYLESSDTREVDGVYYPVWPEDEFTMQFDWEPIVFAVNDGNVLAEAVFKPDSYGETFEEALYTVGGIYHYAQDGESRTAQLHFRNGELVQVFGFTGEESIGAPREILPQAGDTFTVYEQWLDLDENGKVTNVAYEEGKTITFGEAPITWETLDAAAGEYVVGFIVEDLDGNQYTMTTPITVE